MQKIIYTLTLLLLASCGQQKSEQTTTVAVSDTSVTVSETSATNNNRTDEHNLTGEQKKNPNDFLPKGFVVFEKISGDLNRDGTEDCVLIIKGTDKKQIITDEYRGKLDRNRRGIIILFDKKNHFELVVKNENCFSSENEDGGVYAAPELSVEIKKGNLYVNYAQGRYGYRQYNFRYKESDFELIGYDESNGGAVIDSEISINFLTKKKQEKFNTNENAQGGDEVFKETWKEINVNRLIKLSEIKDFDELDMSVY
ncbi:hypothetical protein [Eisenibacter elegans]|uniref:hypothetical protein n=1 Tax=Eisenibacter elegans TaxID=997 RepID=UPI000400F859|nr:hypothetical protein [Eisenibacter elegans]